ncbi:MAG: CubicO group peptidase (beta-lactamase class C family) [Patiriisocius sp.]|jgi:CubicO group peptidase (beta-lactamase class C family)
MDNSIGLDQFNRQIAEAVDQGLLPGAHHLVWESGALVNQQIVGYGHVENEIRLHEHSLFRLASASKLFVSVGLLTLVEEGRLTLTDPVWKVLPEYQDLHYFNTSGEVVPAEQTMIIEDLLRHSCGYGYGNKGPYRQALIDAALLGVDPFGTDHWIHSHSLRDWAKALAEVPMEAEPGTAVSYGLGHDLAGAVIEALTERRLDEFMQEKIFAPLELNDTYFVVPKAREQDLTSFYNVVDGQLQLVETSAMSDFMSQPSSFSGGGGWDMLGNGGLVTSAGDFAKLLQLILADGTLEGVKILSLSLTAKLKTGASDNLAHGEMLPGCTYSYGACCVKDLTKYSGKGPLGKMSWGGSTNTYYYYLPEQQRLGVFLTHTLPFAHLNAIYRFNDLAELE